MGSWSGKAFQRKSDNLEFRNEGGKYKIYGRQKGKWFRLEEAWRPKGILEHLSGKGD